MTKTVFSNAMVAHVWANQSQAGGRSANGNFHFSGPFIYSYRTLIGRAMDGRNGRVFLTSSGSFSVTTKGKHLNPIHRAIIGLGEWYSVPSLGTEFSPPSHAENVKYMLALYNNAIGRAKRARDLYGCLSEDLRDMHRLLVAYCDTFKARKLIPRGINPVADAQAVIAFRAARDARNNTPKTIAARARKKERNRLKAVEGYRSGAVLPGSFEARRGLEALMTDDDRAARASAIYAANAEKIAQWYSGATSYYRFDADCGGAALRAIGDELQTSHGATIPLEHAIRVFRMVKHCREHGIDWHANGHTLKVGYFGVSEIQANGTLRAGCHVIHWPEIERLAKQIGVFDAPEADTTEEAKV